MSFIIPLLSKIYIAIINIFLRICSYFAKDESYDYVFIWDVVEVTGISLTINEMLMKRFPSFDPAGHLLDYLVECVLSFANFDTENEEESVEGYVSNIEETVNAKIAIMKMMAPKYDALRKLYDEISDGLKNDNSIINQNLIRKCGIIEYKEDIFEAARQHQTLLSQLWKRVNRCLKLVNEKSQKKMANVVINTSGVAHAIAQLLVAGQSSQIPIENIYSAAYSSEEEIIMEIQQRFGKKCQFVIVSSFSETKRIAQKLNIPVMEVHRDDAGFDRVANLVRHYQQQ